MRTLVSVFFGVVSVVMVLFVSPACAPDSTVPTVPASPVPAEPSPSYDMLVKNGFVDAAIPRITAEELKLRLDRGEKTILIDTRADWKFEMGHLPEATNIHYAIDSPFPGEEEAMDRELAALPDDALKVLYCN